MNVKPFRHQELAPVTKTRQMERKWPFGPAWILSPCVNLCNNGTNKRAPSDMATSCLKANDNTVIAAGMPKFHVCT